MESSTAQFLWRQPACVQLPKAMCARPCNSVSIVCAIDASKRATFCSTAGKGHAFLSPEWGLAGGVQVAVLCPADCVEGLP